jgi:hypothetical protein
MDLFDRLGLRRGGSGSGRLFLDHNDLSAFSAFTGRAFRGFRVFMLILRTFD